MFDFFRFRANLHSCSYDFYGFLLYFECILVVSKKYDENIVTKHALIFYNLRIFEIIAMYIIRVRCQDHLRTAYQVPFDYL